MAKQEISFYDKGQVDDLLDDKQNILTAGENIRIQNDVISAEVPEGDTFEAGNYTGSAANGQQIVINYGEVDEQDLVTSKYYLSSGQNTDGAMTQKAITDALAVKANAADLATVATTGSYDDLTDKPIIPAGVTLYPGTGQNTDGAMTQKAVTDELLKGFYLIAKYSAGNLSINANETKVQYFTFTATSDYDYITLFSVYDLRVNPMNIIGVQNSAEGTQLGAIQLTNMSNTNLTNVGYYVTVFGCPKRGNVGQHWIYGMPTMRYMYDILTTLENNQPTLTDMSGYYSLEV